MKNGFYATYRSKNKGKDKRSINLSVFLNSLLADNHHLELAKAWHWPSFYNVVTGKTLALPNLIALQHIPLSPAGVIAKRPAPIALPNSCAA